MHATIYWNTRKAFVVKERDGERRKICRRNYCVTCDFIESSKKMSSLSFLTVILKSFRNVNFIAYETSRWDETSGSAVSETKSTAYDSSQHWDQIVPATQQHKSQLTHKVLGLKRTRRFQRKTEVVYVMKN